MGDTSGTSTKTPSSTSSIDEKDLVSSMRKLDLIKELGFVIINHLQNKLLIIYFIGKNRINFNVFKIIYNKILN